MDLSFKEKSAWISFACTLGLFGYYFFHLISFPDMPADQARTSALLLLGKVLVLSIIIESVFHAMLAATNHKAAEMGADERDTQIEQRANQYGYYVLSTGVMIVIGRMVLLEVFPGFDDDQSSLAIPMLTLHILMLSFVLSELTRFGAQILLYRRGY